MKSMLIFLWALGALFAVTDAGSNVSAEQDLLSRLFSDYDKHHLPDYSGSETVNVTIGMSLINLHHLDLFQGTVDLTLWMKMSWVDTRLMWNAYNFDGIFSLNIPASDIWVPDIVLYNSHDTLQTDGFVHALLDEYGGVFIVSPMRVKASCDVRLEDYPYDTQACVLKWGSWSHSSEEIGLSSSSDEIDLSTMTSNTVWHVVGTSAVHSVTRYACCPEAYEDVSFTIRLRRRESHGRIAAAVVTTWLILAVFLIAPTSGGERITFAGFLVVSLVVLEAALKAEVPASSTTRLGRYQLAGLLLTGLVTIYNGLVYRFFPREQPGELQEKSSAPVICLVVDVFVFLVTLLLLAIMTGAMFM